ncbi:MAG: aminotransferase class V-fold PLP-dependent enzyme, partial [Ruminococcaceae bacterium]|nr:aminotransferase class V-fold PLP-dependent enzyme [Oscillospiraceae bacterium]
MIYLDNAATTFPKPDCVINAVTDFMRGSGGNPGRGGHTLSRQSSDKIFECREELSALIGADSPQQIIFTKNATEAINLAIK